MPTIPFRNVGEIGIVPDANPFDLPPNAWSSGSNVRFSSGRVQRAPVFRLVDATNYTDIGGEPEETSPTGALALPAISDYDSVVLAMKNGGLVSWKSGAYEDVTPDDESYALGDNVFPWTSGILQGVVYLNRPDRTPVALRPSDPKFQALPNWDEGWRCRALRPFKDFLFAINLQQGATERPTAVAWSDIPMYGEVPATWDVGDITKLAGDNVLGSLEGPLIDGLALRDFFVLYSTDQVWRVDYIGGRALFAWRQLYTDTGILNQNCAVEVEGKHYVFGPTDIYMHDGTSKQSLVNGRCRSYIFNNLNIREAHVAFVAHDPNLREVHFCYKSGDPDVYWPDTEFCNKAAVYNYVDDTWSFRDLPNVVSYAISSVSSGLTYDTAEHLTYKTIGGTYYDQEDGMDRHFLFIGSKEDARFPESRVYGYEPANYGSRLAFEIDPSTMPPAYLQRIGIDLDEVGAPLNTFKVCKRLYPQIKYHGADAALSFRTGGHLYPSSTPTWSPEIPFDPDTQYKIDVRKGGRYLSLSLTQEAPLDFEFSGFDADIVVTGRR